MTELLAPLVSLEVDLRGFSGFMLDVDRLLASELVALGTPEECWAALMLWCRAWKQQPPASLPNDERVLKAFSGAGARWPRVRAVALRGFVLCSDNRLYHKVLSAEANEAWERRKRFKERSAKANEKRWAGPDTPPEQGSGNKGKAGEGGNPHGNGQAIPEGLQQGMQQGLQQVPRKDSITPPVEETGTGTGQLLQPPLSESPAQPSIPDCPHRELLALYRQYLPMLSQPRLWDGNRADVMRTRWAYCAKLNGIGSGYVTKEQGLEFWRGFFEYVAKVPKLTEGIPRKEGGSWKPDLLWLLKAENFAKVIEGRYE